MDEWAIEKSVYFEISSKMHLAYFVIIALLSIIGATPTNDLEHDLREAVEDAQILINKDEISATLSLAKSIVSNNIAPKEEIDQWKSYSDKLSTWNVTSSRDFVRLEETNLSKSAKKNVDQYSNGEYTTLRIDLEDLRAKRYAIFRVNVMEILEAAKKAGVTHILIDNNSTFNDLTNQEFFFEMKRNLYKKL